jgi:hypothetical protein
VDAEGSGYFARSERARLREGLRQRVNEGRIARLSGKGLRAGVMEAGGLSHPETGVGQGGVRSPVLAPVFLPQVVDGGGEHDVRPRLKGHAFRRRFAADFGMGCALATDARKLMAVGPKRWARCGLPLHPEKTVWMACGKPDARQASAKGNGTCEFLGFPPDWATSRRGFGVMKRRTARKRRRRPKKWLGRWCRTTRHASVTYQYQMLGLKRRGHFRDDGSRGHCHRREAVRRDAEQAGRYWWSRRRSNSAMGWEQVPRLAQTSVLPTPKIVHPI